MIKIKPFQYAEKEYQDLVTLTNIVYPHADSTVIEYRYNDENRNKKFGFVERPAWVEYEKNLMEK